jgi:hypothetical protein
MPYITKKSRVSGSPTSWNKDMVMWLPNDGERQPYLQNLLMHIASRSHALGERIAVKHLRRLRKRRDAAYHVTRTAVLNHVEPFVPTQMYVHICIKVTCSEPAALLTVLTFTSVRMLELVAL